jgi:DNA-binding transcriptional MerR regulator
MGDLKIGALARQTGTNAPTIRYYEEIGLLRSAGRQAGNQRVYGDADVKRLTFIRRCREFGFSIDQVRSLVAGTGSDESLRAGARPCTDAFDGRAREACGVEGAGTQPRGIRHGLRCILRRRRRIRLRDSR